MYSEKFTESLKAVEAAREANIKLEPARMTAQQKEDFVGNFAHELKTPLTSVIGYADMIYQKIDRHLRHP